MKSRILLNFYTDFNGLESGSNLENTIILTADGALQKGVNV